jgi:hypothetical protein
MEWDYGTWAKNRKQAGALIALAKRIEKNNRQENANPIRNLSCSKHREQKHEL